MDEEQKSLPFLPWEKAAWILTVAVLLLVIHGAIQNKLDRANESHIENVTTQQVEVPRFGR